MQIPRNMMKFESQTTPPFDKLYLVPLMDLHRLLFIKLMESKYDTLVAIDLYMKTSEIRQKMDQGNWVALNKGYKQLFNSIDFSKCPVKTEKDEDIYLYHWMADIYTLMQWMYNIPSAEIADKIPSFVLAQKFNPLHETSEKNACEKLYETYFSDRIIDLD